MALDLCRTWVLADTDTDQCQNNSQLELEPTDGVACRCSVVSRSESERKAQTANQLIPKSPVTKKLSLYRPIRTESTECVTEWAKRTGEIGFLSILKAEA